MAPPSLRTRPLLLALGLVSVGCAGAGSSSSQRRAAGQDPLVDCIATPRLGGSLQLQCPRARVVLFRSDHGRHQQRAELEHRRLFEIGQTDGNTVESQVVSVKTPRGEIPVTRYHAQRRGPQVLHSVEYVAHADLGRSRGIAVTCLGSHDREVRADRCLEVLGAILANPWLLDDEVGNRQVVDVAPDVVFGDGCQLRRGRADLAQVWCEGSEREASLLYRRVHALEPDAVMQVQRVLFDDFAKVVAAEEAACRVLDRSARCARVRGTGPLGTLHGVVGLVEREAQVHLVGCLFHGERPHAACGQLIETDWNDHLRHLSGIGATLDNHSIWRVFAQYRDQFRYCYEKELAYHPQAAGRVDLELAIDPSGVVARVEVIKTTLRLEPTETCLVQLVSALRFPPAAKPGTTVVSYPFSFKPRDSD